MVKYIIMKNRNIAKSIRNLVIILVLFSLALHTANLILEIAITSGRVTLIDILPHLLALFMLILVGIYTVFKVKQASDSIYSLTITDKLTGLNNNRKLEQDWDYFFEQFNRYNEVFCIAFIDINHFKQFNDSFGHRKGDIVLREFGKLLLADLRKTDRSYRYGGDEFIIVFHNTNLPGAKIVSNRLIREFDRLDFEIVSLSIGLARVKEGDTKEMILNRADNLMYMIKNEGGGVMSEE